MVAFSGDSRQKSEKRQVEPVFKAFAAPRSFALLSMLVLLVATLVAKSLSCSSRRPETKVNKPASRNE